MNIIRITFVALLAATGFGISAASAQTAISEGQIIQSLVGTGQAAQSAGINVDSIRADISQRIQVEGTENAASPPPVLQALSRMPNFTVQIQFAFDSDWIRPVSWPAMGDIADALHHPLTLSYRFAVIGHTDAKGSREYNLGLSERRAAAVRNMLVTSFRVNPQRLVAIGFGEEQIQDTSNPEGAVNRRVQLINLGPL